MQAQLLASTNVSYSILVTLSCSYQESSVEISFSVKKSYENKKNSINCIIVWYMIKIK